MAPPIEYEVVIVRREMAARELFEGTSDVCWKRPDGAQSLSQC
jgi:hypothetical protein